MSLSVLSRRQLLFPSALPPGSTPGPTPTEPPVSPGPTDPPSTPVPTEPPPVEPTEPATPTEPAEPTGPLIDGEIGADAVLLSPADAHLLSRFSWGLTPSLADEAVAAGGARAWFDQQLDPASIPDGPADELITWWDHLLASPAEKFRLSASGEVGGTDQDIDYMRWYLLHAMKSRRQLLDVVADFWANHFFIMTPLRKTFTHRVTFDAMIRKNALGSFDDLLTAVTLHPAMLNYLDNARSTKSEPNENLGRELLELHTVGRGAAYTEADVLSSTRILTGYMVEQKGTCEAYYNEAQHWTGPVKVLGFEHANAAPDGRPVVAAYLDYLAKHAETAKRIMRKLAVRFVSDNPSDGLVADLVSAFSVRRNIIDALVALVDHPEFQAAAGLKVRTPVEDFICTHRVLQTDIHRPTGVWGEAANMIIYRCEGMGQRPFDWPRPDGFPDIADAWSSASRMLGSWRIHNGLACSFLPAEGIDFKPKSFWHGSLPVTFGELVERLSVKLLGKAPTERLRAVARKAVDAEDADVIDPTSGIIQTKFGPLMLSILDTPDHMTR